MLVIIKKKILIWSIQIFIDLIRHTKHFFGINNYISMNDQRSIGTVLSYDVKLGKMIRA